MPAKKKPTPTSTSKPHAKKPSAKNVTKKTTPITPKNQIIKKEPVLKRKELSQEEMFPFKTMPFRLEYKDGNETRICHFTCEEHRTKIIERYKLRKGTYFIDDCL